MDEIDRQAYVMASTPRKIKLASIISGGLMFAPRLVPFIVLSIISIAHAQATDSKPAQPQSAAPTTRPTRPAARNFISPEILPDHRVTIRIVAPKASDVSIGGDFGEGKKLTKDESG